MRLPRSPKWEERNRADAEHALTNAGLPHRAWLAQYLVNRFGTESPRRVLELGSSYGPNLMALAAIAPEWKMVGIDISPANVQIGREQLDALGADAPPISLAVGDISRHLNFPDDSFDVVFTDAALLYLNPLQVRRALREMIRVASG